MNQKTIISAVIILVVPICGLIVWKLPKVPSTPVVSTSDVVTIETALTQLQSDMVNITPHLVVPTWQQGQMLTTDEKKIEANIGMLLTAQYVVTYPKNPVFKFRPGNDFWINAIGKRYILAALAGADSLTDVIIDSQTGQVTPISKTLRHYFAPERDIVLYIDKQSLYTYSLDQATTTLVAGSQLSGTETYHNGYIDGVGIQINPQETHTKNSITISIFDSSKMVENPDVPGAQMYAKIGQKALSF